MGPCIIRMNVPFHNIGGVIPIFLYFFRFYEYLSKTSSVFQFQRSHFGCLTGLEVFLFMWGVLGPCIASNFSLLQVLF